MNALPNLGTRFGFRANSRLSSFLSWWQGELAALVPASAHGILLSAGKRLLLHLGMSGSIRVLPESRPPEKHDHFDIETDAAILRFNDPRRFGTFLWCDSPVESHPLLASLGKMGADFFGALLDWDPKDEVDHYSEPGAGESAPGLRPSRARGGAPRASLQWCAMARGRGADANGVAAGCGRSATRRRRRGRGARVRTGSLLECPAAVGS